MDTLLEQASPLPWHVRGKREVESAGGTVVVCGNYNEYGCSPGTDAELIVRAVNAYEPLVKALREIVEKGDILNRYVSDMRLEEHTMLAPSIRAAQGDYVAARRAALATVTESDSGTLVESSPEREMHEANREMEADLWNSDR